MANERPEKRTVRQLWVDEVRLADNTSPPDAVPLYTTLAGAEGGDIQALVEAEVIALEENGAIADADAARLVAVESSPIAVVALARRFPGLKILEEPIQNLLRSTSPITWPVGEHRACFRAQVVNLDLNGPLEATVQDGQLFFPALALVRKLATLHAQPPLIPWTLCMTLHGNVAWNRESQRLACEFLAANFEDEPAFSEAAKQVLGEAIHAAICDDPRAVRLGALPPVDQQRLLKVLVPKRIAFDVHRDGWRVDTIENLRYGGTQRRAPMVTWVMRFEWDVRASTRPSAVYRDALGQALSRHGRIDPAGNLERE